MQKMLSYSYSLKLRRTHTSYCPFCHQPSTTYDQHERLVPCPECFEQSIFRLCRVQRFMLQKIRRMRNQRITESLNRDLPVNVRSDELAIVIGSFL